ALYQFRQSMTGGVSEGYVDVLEAIGDSPAATRGIWQFLLGIDWTASVRASILPVDHPLFLLLAHPRRMRFRIRDGLWTRPVDVGAALSARRYAAESEVVLEVRDDSCPWNEARYVLAAAEGEGKADRTTRPPENAGDVVGALPAAPEPLVFAVPMRGPLESPFGPRWGGFHAGIDIGVLRTDAVHAALPGVVLAVGWLPHYEGYGNVVKLRGPGGIITLYAHLARSLVRPGQRVGQGQLIGRAGCTGS